MAGKRGSRRKQLLDDLEGRRYCTLREEALDRTLWRIRFARGNGPVVNTQQAMNDAIGRAVRAQGGALFESVTLNVA